MGKEIWFTSDTHFGHANILTFTDESGQLMRPGFASVEEMDEVMVERWNKVVRPQDRVYHLGDVALSESAVTRILPRLNGSKRLLLGNHDVDTRVLRPYFKKITLWRIFKDEGFVVTHIPMRPEQFRYVPLNVHGHLHERVIDDPRYCNVCVELTDYTPVHIDTLTAKAEELKATETPDALGLDAQEEK